MRQRIRISNEDSEEISVLLEPIAEEKRLKREECLHIVVDFSKETRNLEDILEISYSNGRITIYCSAAANGDWEA